MIFSDFFKALGQFGDPRFRRVVFKGLGLSLVLLFAFNALMITAVNIFLPEVITLPWVGEVAFVSTILSWGAILLMIGLSGFLMMPVASAFTGLFLDEVSEAVEDRHYPHLPKPPHTALGDMLMDSVNFLGVLIGLNILGLIAYPFLGPFAPLAFWALNGFLLGREYFQMAAMRWHDRHKAKELRRKHSATIWFAGFLMAIPLSIPLINLLIPVLGAATFTHLYQRLEGRG